MGLTNSTQTHDSSTNKTFTCDGTFMRFHDHKDEWGHRTGDTIIECNVLQYKEIILKKSNVRYAELYNKLTVKNVYKFEYDSNMHLLDILEPSVYVKTATITGILHLRQIYDFYNNIPEAYQLVLDNSIIKIIFYDADIIKELIINKKYELNYIKHTSLDYYELTGYTLIEENNNVAINGYKPIIGNDDDVTVSLLI